MPVTSREAMDFLPMLDAVRVAFDRRSTPEGFLEHLHEQGFMVVPIPPPEPMPIAQPYEPTKPPPLAWHDWYAEVKRIDPVFSFNEADLTRLYGEGKTPKEAVDDILPF